MYRLGTVISSCWSELLTFDPPVALLQTWSGKWKGNVATGVHKGSSKLQVCGIRFPKSLTRNAAFASIVGSRTCNSYWLHDKRYKVEALMCNTQCVNKLYSDINWTYEENYFCSTLMCNLYIFRNCWCLIFKMA